MSPQASVEKPIQFDSVEELVGVLGEAAEIEHGLMCCYLYALWGLKTSDNDGLSADELAAVRKWRKSILDVAIEEMAHLALVSNVMCALGLRPHFGRQNFPVSPGYHPADIAVALAPFDRDTLDHFIFLERPEGIAEQDGKGFVAKQKYARGSESKHLTPVAQDYATVGHLYRGVAEGIKALCITHGETNVFCGHKAAQIGPDIVQLPGLMVIDSLETALLAISKIVEQGEGAPGHSEDSHYQRFLNIRHEYEAILAKNPSFVPSRPIARNPVMRRPPVPEGRVFVDAPDAVALLDLANALYNQLVRFLIQAFGRADRDTNVQRVLIDCAIDIMGIMSPVAEALTQTSASPSHPGVNAGVTFATMRFYQPFVRGRSEWLLLEARLRELAEGTRTLKTLLPCAEALATRLVQMAQRFSVLAEEHKNSPFDAAKQEQVAMAPTTSQIPAPTSSVEVAVGKDITIKFDAKRCIHSRFCVLWQPQVYKANTPGAWIDPDQDSVEGVIGVAHNCPSGAIQYERHDGGPAEPAPRVNLVNVRENGPLAFRGELVLDGQPIGMRATLCRCGQSKNKPFCDGSHNAAAFKASGEPVTQDGFALATRNGPVTIAPQHNGPLKVAGNLEICSGTGRTILKTTSTKLCRCGHSNNKPYCDGSHIAAGFSSDN